MSKTYRCVIHTEQEVSDPVQAAFDAADYVTDPSGSVIVEVQQGRKVWRIDLDEPDGDKRRHPLPLRELRPEQAFTQPELVQLLEAALNPVHRDQLSVALVRRLARYMNPD